MFLRVFWVASLACLCGLAAFWTVAIHGFRVLAGSGAWTVGMVIGALLLALGLSTAWAAHRVVPPEVPLAPRVWTALTLLLFIALPVALLLATTLIPTDPDDGEDYHVAFLMALIIGVAMPPAIVWPSAGLGAVAGARSEWKWSMMAFLGMVALGIGFAAVRFALLFA